MAAFSRLVLLSSILVCFLIFIASCGTITKKDHIKDRIHVLDIEKASKTGGGKEFPEVYVGSAGIYNVDRIYFSPDGETMATVYCGTVDLWNLKTGILRLHLHFPYWVDQFRFAPDGATIAVVYRSHEIDLLDSETGTLISPRLEGPYKVEHLEFTSDGHALVAASYHEPKVWSLQTDEVLFEGSLPSGEPIHALSRDGYKITTYSFNFFSPNIIRVYESVSGELIYALKAKGLAPGRHFFSSDGNLLFDDSGHGDKRKVFVIDLAAKSYKSHKIVYDRLLQATSIEGNFLTTGYRNREDGKTYPLTLHDQKTGNPICSYAEYHGRGQPVFGPNGKYIANIESRDSLTGQFPTTETKIWNAKSCELFDTFELDIPASRVRFTHDGKRIALAGRNGTVLWDVETGEEVCRFFSFGKDDWAVLTPHGYYRASERGEKHVKIRTEPHVLEDIEQFKSVFNRPDLVEQVLAGKRVPEISAKDPYMKIGFDIQTENGDKIVHAGERVDLTFEISNEGKGRAAPSKLRIESELISKTLELDRFRPDETRTEKVSFNAPYDLENGTVQVVAKLQVAGNSLCSLEISLRTRAVLPPTFRLGFEIDDRPDGESQGDGNGVLAPGERAKLWITVENVGQGDAKGVSLTLSPVGVELRSDPTLQIGDLQPGSSIRRKFILFVPSGVEKNDINATVQVLEARKIFDHIEKFYPEDYESGPVKIDLSEAAELPPIVKERKIPRPTYPPVVPVKGRCASLYPNRYLAAFGVSDYTYLEDLPYVKKDLELIKEIAECHLGVRGDNTIIFEDPSKDYLLGELSNMIDKAKQDDSIFFFYFSGHGQTDNEGHSYLFPKSYSSGNLKQSGISLQTIINKLQRARGQKLLIVDACRHYSEKAISVVGKEVSPRNTAVIYSAAKGQASTLRKEADCSAFTHALLKVARPPLSNLDTTQKSGYVEIDELGPIIKVTTSELSPENQVPEIIGDPKVRVFPLKNNQ